MTDELHIVTDGEDGASIAFRYGFATFDPIATFAANQELLKRRPNPAQLFPGDVLFIPSKQEVYHPLSPETATHFVVTVPTRKVELALSQDGVGPEGGIPYTLTAGAITVEGKSDSRGMIEQELPADEPHAVVVLEDGTMLSLAIGGLNPLRDVPDHGASGAAQRLVALGYVPGPLDGSDIVTLSAAVRAFQSDHGLSADGQLDPATLLALETAYGQ